MGFAYRAFGDLGVVDEAGTHHPVSGRQADILAVLLASYPNSATTDRLIDEIWSDSPPKDPESALHNAVSRLRSRIGADLVTTSGGYELRAGSIDYVEFELAVAKARETGRPDDYERAARLWGGDPFRGFETLATVQLETQRLIQLHHRALLERLAVMIDHDQSSLAADELRLIVEADPYDEEAIALYMKALYKSGKKPAALAAFRTYEAQLAEETGLEPSADIRELELAILVDEFERSEPVSRSVSPFEMAISYVDLRNGQRIAVGSAGSGPPIVVHPGWMSKLDLVASGLDMRTPTWSALARTHELTIFDRSGTGLSRPAVDRLTFEQSVGELAEVIEMTHDEPVAIWAASGAGPIAIRVALDRPELVSHLILFATYASGPATFPREVARSMIALVRSSWGMGSEVLANLLFPSGSREIRDTWARQQREMADTETAALLMRLFYDADVAADLPHLEVPSLVLHYRGDKAIPMMAGEHLAREIPGARLVPLEGVSHYPLPGQEERVVEIIDRFWEETAG